MDLKALQAAIATAGLDGWLFCDFHNRDPIALRILGMDPERFLSRRWYFYVPSRGEPVRLVSRVEEHRHDFLPGKKRTYLSWRDLHGELRSVLGEKKTIAMQYSPMNNIPYVSITDAGTIELIRSFGHDIVSSADLVQIFEALLDDKAFESHLEAGRRVDKVRMEAYEAIARSVRDGQGLTEYDIQQLILRRFAESGLSSMGEGPIVGVNDHPADPHFEPTKDNARRIDRGNTVLIDLWAKLDQPGAIVYDITWCGFVGNDPPPKYVEIFEVVRDARKAAIAFISGRLAQGGSCFGWEVDDACRKVVVDRGYGEAFLHRTGHSIGEKTHGNGVNIDNLETKDERELLPGSLFSIEPGIYLEGKMAVRSEINGFVNHDRQVVVTGAEQEKLILLDV
jgi:Xaa-Pro aminopeptidase